jgi:hypothetical protein
VAGFFIRGRMRGMRVPIVLIWALLIWGVADSAHHAFTENSFGNGLTAAVYALGLVMVTQGWWRLRRDVVVLWLRQIHWQFSLRTLLIATTLVAVVLGLIVWAVR